MTNEDGQTVQQAWESLETELDAWQAAKRIASFWWRDDDATAPGPKLDRLLELSADSGLLLAVIPERAETALAATISGAPLISVAQHGYAHVNHAPRGQGLGAWELGLHRGEAAVMADLDKGRRILESKFTNQFMPVIVPPWNRIDASLLKPIARRGYTAISAFGPCSALASGEKLEIVNVHCDPIRWKSGARFAGTVKVIDQLLAHLRSRRSGQINADEVTGFLTHHIDLDAAAWDFCHRLSKLVSSHPGARWSAPREIFPIP